MSYTNVANSPLLKDFSKLGLTDIKHPQYSLAPITIQIQANQ